jgi:hypothetical protein
MPAVITNLVRSGGGIVVVPRSVRLCRQECIQPCIQTHREASNTATTCDGTLLTVQQTHPIGAVICRIGVAKCVILIRGLA